MPPHGIPNASSSGPGSRIVRLLNIIMRPKMLGGGMRRSRAVLKDVLVRVGMGVPVAWLALATAVVHGQVAPSPADAKVFTDMVNTRCVKCHNADDWAGS